MREKRKRNFIIMQLLKGVKKTEDIKYNVKKNFYLEVSDRYIQEVRKEVLEKYDEHGCIFFTPYCDICGEEFDFRDIAVIFNSKFKTNMKKDLNGYNWFFGNIHTLGYEDKVIVNKVFNLTHYQMGSSDVFLCGRCKNHFIKEKEEEIRSTRKLTIWNSINKNKTKGGEEMYWDAKKEEESKLQNENRDNDEYFEVEIDHVKKCSKVPNELVVNIEDSVLEVFKKFMKWAGKQEWLAYLKGKYDPNKPEEEAFINGIVLPNQDASSALVHNIHVDDYENVIGVIHSHHEMGIGFSGHDWDFINGNHHISLLISKKEITGVARAFTPCGALKRMNVKMKRFEKELTEEDKKLKDNFMEKINFTQKNINNSNEDGSITIIRDNIMLAN